MNILENENVLVLDAILNLLYLRVTYCKKRNVSEKSTCPGQGGMKHLYGKNRPAQAGLPVAETRIPARRDGTKNFPHPFKQYATKTIEIYTCRDPTHRPVPVKSRPASHVNSPECLQEALP